MEPLPDHPPPRCGAVAGRMLAGAVALTLLAASGCEQWSAPAAPAVVAPPTPAERLAHVIDRLGHALTRARPVAGSGVSSTRGFAYRLIEPANGTERHTAEVVIETRVRFIPRQGGLTQPSDDAEAPRLVAKPVRKVGKRVFKLSFDGQRWQLVRPPQDELTETERICFQYALSDG